MSISEKQKKTTETSSDITSAISGRDSSASQSNRFNMSTLELIERLKAKEITVAGLPKEILRRCALFMRSRGHSYSYIAEVMELSDKTIQRYVHEMREQESLKLGANFQKSIAAEFLNSWRAHSQRLLMLSYSPDLSVAEQIKTIFVLHQVEKDGIEVLERLGYLNKLTGEDEVRFAYKKDLKRLANPENLYEDLGISEKIKELSHEDMGMVTRYALILQQEMIKKINQTMEQLKPTKK